MFYIVLFLLILCIYILYVMMTSDDKYIHANTQLHIYEADRVDGDKDYIIEKRYLLGWIPLYRYDDEKPYIFKTPQIAHGELERLRKMIKDKEGSKYIGGRTISKF